MKASLIRLQLSMAVETVYQQDDRRLLLLDQRKDHESEDETDRLSILPRHMIDLILSYLPLDDAIRTSVLSKRWRHMWKTLPDIVFNKECFSVSLKKKEEALSNELKLVRAVSQVLENHSGIIRKFEINHLNFNRAHVDIDWWIQRLSNSPVREFILDIWGRRGGRYKMHPSLLECKGLIRLDLWNCSFDHFPLAFGVFRNLKNLNLYSVPMSQERLENLVGSCPLLEMLYYYNDESYFPTLKFDAPRLFRFKFGGFFDKLILKHSEKLAQVCFSMEWSKSNKSKEAPLAFTSNLIDFFKCLVNVQTLHIKTQFLKYLIHGYVPERLPRPFSNVTSFGIETDPVCKQEIEAILCMLKSFPRLRTIAISFRGTTDYYAVGSTNYFQEDKYKGLVLPEVRIVEASRFSNRFSELNLLELILSACPNLKRLSVVDFISSRGMCPIEDTFHRLRLASRPARATILRRESCSGTCPEVVYVWLNGLHVPYIPPHISESPPVLQEI